MSIKSWISTVLQGIVKESSYVNHRIHFNDFDNELSMNAAMSTIHYISMIWDGELSRNLAMSIKDYIW